MTLRLLSALLLLAAIPSLAADSDFNGRWDLTTLTQPRPRAWWVELTGVGTPKPAGKFVSAYGGDMNTLDTVAVENGELRFTIANQGRNAKGPAPVYRARLVNGKLEGTLETPGSSTAPLKWTGVRAPAIADKDDGSWQEGKPIELFNGKDLTGWKPLNPGAEIQILEDYGKPPNAHGAAALYSRIAPSVNASKPPAEWQSYDIRLVGRTLTVVHNGVKVLDKVEVEGLTAIANNSDEAEPGPFIIQGDH